jgi:hypothetical protein
MRVSLMSQRWLLSVMSLLRMHRWARSCCTHHFVLGLMTDTASHSTWRGVPAAGCAAGMLHEYIDRSSAAVFQNSTDRRQTKVVEMRSYPAEGLPICAAICFQHALQAGQQSLLQPGHLPGPHEAAGT